MKEVVKKYQVFLEDESLTGHGRFFEMNHETVPSELKEIVESFSKFEEAVSIAGNNGIYASYDEKEELNSVTYHYSIETDVAGIYCYFVVQGEDRVFRFLEDSSFDREIHLHISIKELSEIDSQIKLIKSVQKAVGKRFTINFTKSYRLPRDYVNPDTFYRLNTEHDNLFLSFSYVDGAISFGFLIKDGDSFKNDVEFRFHLEDFKKGEIDLNKRIERLRAFYSTAVPDSKSRLVEKTKRDYFMFEKAVKAYIKALT